MRSSREPGWASKAAIYATLIAVTLAFAAPLIWMVSTSFKPVEQTMVDPPTLLPEPVTKIPSYAIDNYVGRIDENGEVIQRGVLRDPVIDFPLYLRNTLIVVGLSLTGMVLSSAVVAYGFSRVKWRGRNVLFFFVLATMMIPFPVLMGPLFILYREFGWIGSFKPLWVPAWFGSAFSIFLLRQFYMTIPREIDEAATIDGCSHWGIFWRMVVPLSRPALAVVALFHFVATWNDFLAPLIFLRDRDQFTLALGLQLYQSQAGNVPWNLLMAASTLVMLPILIVFLLAQRTFIEGIATSGLKE
ncbi:MAG: carbohydrate ABC transporter permease [Planctomycetota bacterium]